MSESQLRDEREVFQRDVPRVPHGMAGTLRAVMADPLGELFLDAVAHSDPSTGEDVDRLAGSGVGVGPDGRPGSEVSLYYPVPVDQGHPGHGVPRASVHGVDHGFIEFGESYAHAILDEDVEDKTEGCEGRGIRSDGVLRAHPR